MNISLKLTLKNVKLNFKSMVWHSYVYISQKASSVHFNGPIPPDPCVIVQMKYYTYETFFPPVITSLYFLPQDHPADKQFLSSGHLRNGDWMKGK